MVEVAPWALAKRRSEPGVEARLASALYGLIETLRLVSFFCRPFLPSTAVSIDRQLGLNGQAAATWQQAARWGEYAPGTRLLGGEALFSEGVRRGRGRLQSMRGREETEMETGRCYN